MSPSRIGLCALALSSVLPSQQLALGAQAPPIHVARWLRGDGIALAGDGIPPVTVMAVLAPGSPHLRNRRAYLSDLQRRFGDRGLQVVVVLTGATEPIAGESAFHVAEDDAGRTAAGYRLRGSPTHGPWFFVLDGERTLLWIGHPETGLAHAVAAGLSGDAVPEQAARAAALKRAIVIQVETAVPAQLLGTIQALCKDNPLDAELWALRFRLVVERSGDRERARQVVAEGVAALAGESAPLGAFAEAVVHIAPHDRELMRLLVVALTPAAPAAPDDLRLQIAYLRALHGVAMSREAGRLAAALGAKIDGRSAWWQLELAAALADAPEPLVHRDLAERVLELAAARVAAAPDAGDRRLMLTRYKVALRCAGDTAAAERIAKRRIADLGGRGGINDEAWYLMSEPETKGRFHDFALRLCEELLATPGQMDYFEYDTCALARFCGGDVDGAIELQRIAIDKAGGAEAKPAYVERLRRYRAAKGSRQKTK